MFSISKTGNPCKKGLHVLCLSIYDISLSVPIDGPISKVYVKEGSVVKKGDKLLKLDDVLQNLEVKRRMLIWKDISKLKTLTNY